MNKIIDFFNSDTMVENSFYLTYVFLLTTATITFIEAMRTNDKKIRNILNLETCISVVAAYFYEKFVHKVDKENIDYKNINMTRYIDWFITTPLMILVLCLAFLYNLNKSLHFGTFLKILFLNFAMLSFGYFGEIELISRNVSLIFGFIFFFALYGYIYYKFIYESYF